MAVWERNTQNLRHKEPSFSSSLLDAIYRSIDETRVANEQQETKYFESHRRNNAAQVKEDIEGLRRVMMIEKWVENYTNSRTRSSPRHFHSNSGSSTDSSMLSSSETESAFRSSPKLSVFQLNKPKNGQRPPKERPTKILQRETVPKREGKLTRTMWKAPKIYGDLKKVKEPISPGGKIANFLNSIFSPRSLKQNQDQEEWSSMRKSRSMKDSATCKLASRSCLSKNASSRDSKSKRSVRFYPDSVIVNEDCQPCGHKNIYSEEYTISPPGQTFGSQFIKKNIDDLRLYEGKNRMKHELGDHYQNEYDLDEMSCGSSDLFELENIGRVGTEAHEEELPVFGTTRLEMNQTVAGGL